VALVGGIVWAGAAVAAGGSPVEELTKRLPDGVVGFVATSGGDALKGDFEKTSLGRIWNDPGVRSLYQSVKTQLLAKMQAETGDSDETRQIDMVLGMAQLVTDRPVALGVAQLKGPVQTKDKPPVYAFVILDPGARKAEFQALVKKLEALLGDEDEPIADVNVGSAKMRGPKDQSDLPLYWGWSGDYLVLAANDTDGLALQYVQKPRPATPEYLKKVPSGGDALIVHADLQKTIGIVDAVARQEDPNKADTIAKVLKELGLSGVRTFTARAGFAGPDLVMGSFLEVAGPRTGLVATLKPVDPALLDMVDARAVTAGVANLDVAGAYDVILRAVKAASSEAGATMEKGLAALESEAKVNLRKGLLESLAGPSVFYTLGVGTVPDAPAGGFVALIKLKDADLFEKTMTGLGAFAATQSEGALQVSEQKRDDGRTVHTWMVPQLAMMQVMPVWSVAKDYAVIGSNAGAHDAMLKQMAATGAERKSIRDTAGYKEVAARLSDNLVTLDYADSQTQYTQAMMVLQQFWPMAAMFAGQANFKLPPTLPALGDIIKDMKPMCRFRWVGPDGIYTQYRGPGIEASLSGVAGAAVGAGLMLPALAKARDQARSAADMSNLKQIGLGLMMYAEDHQGNWPANLEQAKSYFGSPKVLESLRKPKDFEGPSYVYVGGQPKGTDPRNIVVYENPEFCTDRINVLFLDGHVEAMNPEAFRSGLKATCERLGREMPEVKFKGEAEVKPRAPRPARPDRAPKA
jgi:prepilin-type processing-associated H-X9-DG protein